MLFSGNTSASNRMKAKTLRACILLLAFAACQQIASTARAAVTFNVTPSAVSNTYNGTIMLQVSGLTNTETVLVQKLTARSCSRITKLPTNSASTASSSACRLPNFTGRRTAR